MKTYLQISSIFLAGSVLWTSCASTTLIQSIPPGAKVYLNGEPVGTTPYVHTDTKVVSSTTSLKLVKEGYQPLHTSFARDEEVDIGAIVAGMLIFFPFIWTMKYKPTHTYELVPVSSQPADTTPGQSNPKTKEERLRELKQLHEQKLISPEDYEQQKAKILNEI